MDNSQSGNVEDTASRPQHAFFDTLLSRQSHWPLAEPGPSETELGLIFDAAMRAPGADAYDPNLWAALDFEPSERVLGFLFVGTPKSREPSAVRASHSAYVREWLGRASI